MKGCQNLLPFALFSVSLYLHLFLNLISLCAWSCHLLNINVRINFSFEKLISIQPIHPLGNNFYLGLIPRASEEVVRSDDDRQPTLERHFYSTIKSYCSRFIALNQWAKNSAKSLGKVQNCYGTIRLGEDGYTRRLSQLSDCIHSFCRISRNAFHTRGKQAKTFPSIYIKR